MINEHPRIGLTILEAIDLPTEIVDFVEGHHERLDGSGYPNGLRGEQVSVIARIAAVADVYDAVTTTRPYSATVTPEEALALLRSQAGTLLDPHVVDALAAVLPEWEQRLATESELQGLGLSQVDGQEITV